MGDHAMPLKSTRCFVVADGGHARFLWAADDHGLHTVEAMDSATLHQRTHDLVSDKEGRSFESASGSRHAYSPRHDPHEMEKERFAGAVSEKIAAFSASDAFEELVLVAPSHILNHLTDALDTVTKAKLVGTLAKDLTKVPEHDLSPHLKEWIRPVHRAS
jgi:protein required for attachment to host cells